jgi:hypothetical protein
MARIQWLKLTPHLYRELDTIARVTVGNIMIVPQEDLRDVYMLREG